MREERREERGERENHGPYSRPGRALLFALTVTVTNELTAACTGTPAAPGRVPATDDVYYYRTYEKAVSGRERRRECVLGTYPGDRYMRALSPPAAAGLDASKRFQHAEKPCKPGLNHTLIRCGQCRCCRCSRSVHAPTDRQHTKVNVLATVPASLSPPLIPDQFLRLSPLHSFALPLHPTDQTDSTRAPGPGEQV